MKQYHDLLTKVLEEGVPSDDRTGTGTISLFGTQTRYNLLEDGFPLVTTKKVPFKSVIAELVWFMQGLTNSKQLNDMGSTIWDEWATESGDLGPIYGKMWRSWPAIELSGMGVRKTGIDQLQNVIDEIRTNPDSRRLVVSAWNPQFLPDPKLTAQENVKAGKQALPPCHTLFQFYSREANGQRYLSLQMYQRSADLFLGVPFNIASYSALLMLVAKMTGHVAHEFIHTIGDAHIYTNHLEQVQKQLKREPKPLPKLTINAPDLQRVSDVTLSMFELEGYEHHPAIKGAVAV